MDPRGPIASLGGSVPVLLRKHIHVATCDFPGGPDPGGPDPGGPIASLGGSVPVPLRKHIATCDFPGDPDPGDPIASLGGLRISSSKATYSHL